MNFEKNRTSETNQVESKNKNQIYFIVNAYAEPVNIVLVYKHYAAYMNEEYITNIKTNLESFFKNYNQEFNQYYQESEIQGVLDTINETHGYLLEIPLYLMPSELKQECLELLIKIKNLADQRLELLKSSTKK